MNAGTMKVGTATSERGDSQAMPLLPWPLGQPLPKWTPMPTSTPPMASAPVETGTLNAISPPPEQEYERGMIAPARKAARHCQSGESSGGRAGQDAGHAGGAAVERHAQNRRKADKTRTRSATAMV